MDNSLKTKTDEQARHFSFYGGSERIRTSGTVARTHAFQACSLNHSDTLPSVGARIIDCGAMFSRAVWVYYNTNYGNWGKKLVFIVGRLLTAGLAVRVFFGDDMFEVSKVGDRSGDGEEKAEGNDEEIGAREKVRAAGGGEFAESEESEAELEGKDSDDTDAEEDIEKRTGNLVGETSGDDLEGKDEEVDETEDGASDGGGEEGATEVGRVGGEGMGFLEGEGGGEDDAGDEVEDDADDEEFYDVVIDTGGEEDSSNREEMNGVEGVMKNDDLEEAVEEEETEGGREGNESEMEHINEDVDGGGTGMGGGAVDEEEE